MPKKPAPKTAALLKGGAPRRQSSFMAVLADLGVGESASRAVRWADLYSDEAAYEGLRAAKERLRGNCNASATAVAARDGKKFSTEVGELITHSGILYVVAIVTRL